MKFSKNLPFYIVFAAAKISTLSANMFLKEILTGRCYDHPPSGKKATDAIAICPSVVGSFVSVLEGHTDAYITAPDFDEYFEKSDFSSPPDQALFWLRFMGGHSEHFPDSYIWNIEPPQELITPEKTPGGALLQGLSFCGVGQQNCKAEESNAYWTFWEAAYAEFTKDISGKVQILVEPFADATFLERSAINNMKPEQVTEATIYGVDCSSIATTKLVSAFKKVGIMDASCKDDLVEFVLCQDDESKECKSYHTNNDSNDKLHKTDDVANLGNIIPVDIDDEEEAPAAVDNKNEANQTTSEDSHTKSQMDSHKKHHPVHGFFWNVFWLCFILFVGNYLYKEYKKGTFHSFVSSEYESLSDTNTTGSSDGKAGGNTFQADDITVIIADVENENSPLQVKIQ